MEKSRFIVGIVGVYLLSLGLFSGMFFDPIPFDEDEDPSCRVMCPWCECHQLTLQVL